MATSKGAILHKLAGKAPDLMGEIDLALIGYDETEFLVEGTATSFSLEGEQGEDGKWDVAPSGASDYRTRILVRRPTDPRRFSGTAIVEWNNVSSGIDASPDWALFHRYLVDAGHAWVGVSAQKVGIDGGGFVEGIPLKVLAPDRYGTLVHPGDAWSFDIFSQIGALLRLPAAENPLGGLEPTYLLAAGESQSAACLVTYINAVDPSARLFDGFFVHGRPDRGLTLDGTFLLSADRSQTLSDLADANPSGGEQIRDDARVPVLIFQSETDVIVLGSGRVDQRDTDTVRVWELAGAAHADTYLLTASRSDDGNLGVARLAELMRPSSDLPIGKTDTPINAGPQQHYVGQAAISHLIRWVAEGVAPPSAPRLKRHSEEFDFIFDQHGNVQGGIRSPWVDVPTAVLSGLGQTGNTFAILLGRTEPFDESTLSRLYPKGKAEYLDRFSAALDATIAEGFILGEDRKEIRGVAAASFPLVVTD